MNDTNKIIFRRVEYRSDDEFFETVFKQMRLLIETGHVLSFHENPNVKGVYALQFNPTHVSDIDITYPVWLNGEEIVYVSAFARRNSYEDAKQEVQDYESDDDWNFGDDGGTPNA